MYLLFYLSSDSEEDYRERIERRRLRDRSNPLSLPNAEFIQRFRVNKDAFNHILQSLEFKGHMSTAVPPALQLAATLCLLGSGGHQHSIGKDYLIGICQSGVSKITTRVIKEMEEKLCPAYITFDDEWNSCKNYFFQKYRIPGVIGCVDGTHFGLQKPSANEHMFLNSEKFYSLNSMIICNHELKIIAVNPKYGGAVSDSFVWKHSEERRFLERKYESSTNENSWLLADSGYPLEPWCITPYRNPQLGSNEALFNDVHSKARSTIERTISILKGHWKVLIYARRRRYPPEKHARFLNVCCALHNVCIDFKVPFSKPYIDDASTTVDTVEVIDTGNENLASAGEINRSYIKNSLI